MAKHTLKGGRTAGEIKELGIVESAEDCIEKCCGEKNCEVAFLVNDTCHSVECYGDELCQSVPMEDENISPTIIYMNSRNGKRSKDKGNYFKNPLTESFPKIVRGTILDKHISVLKLCRSFLESRLCPFLGTCASLCLSGVCTAKDKCTCDRGFEGTNCNDTAITGELKALLKKEKR